MERLHLTTVPTSDTVATATVVDGYTTAQSDRAGISTGIWIVEYSAENRPASFTSEDSNTIIEAAYDYMGRRAWKKTTVDGEVTAHEGYLYRGYLQIACIDLTRSTLNGLYYLIWDPSERTATRHLALQRYGSWFTFGLDISKNVKELFNPSSSVVTTYDYSPFGAASRSGSTKSPVQWSSEITDDELGLVYYNYRHYNPADGRWINRDPIAEQGGLNLFAFVENRVWLNDDRGLNFPQVPLEIPTNRKDCPPQMQITVGGALDSKSGNAYLLYYGQASQGNAACYCHWDTDIEDMANQIEQYRKKCPKTNILLIGHSYGGDTAKRIARKLDKHNSHLVLVTLDPVSSYSGEAFSNDKPESVDAWINAYVKLGFSGRVGQIPILGQALGGLISAIPNRLVDTIAATGGKWGYESGADVNIQFPLGGSVSHGNASYLYRSNNHQSRTPSGERFSAWQYAQGYLNR